MSLPLPTLRQKTSVPNKHAEYQISTRNTLRPVTTSNMSNESTSESTANGDNEQEIVPESLGSPGNASTSAPIIPPRNLSPHRDPFNHVRLPNFWNFDSQNWLNHLDQKFALFNIQSQVHKYLLTIEAIPANDLKSFRLPSANAPNCYDLLKAEILRNFDHREDEIELLLSDLVITDQNPKHLMRQLINVVGSENLSLPVKKLIRTKFLQALPREIAIALASSNYDDNLYSLASKAHEAMLLKRSRPLSGGLCNLALDQQKVSEPQSQARSTTKNWQDKVPFSDNQVSNHNDFSRFEKFQHHAPNLRRPGNSQPRPPQSWNTGRQGYRGQHSFYQPRQTPSFSGGNQSSFPGRFRGPRQTGHLNVQTICFYHAKFGNKARKCEPSCQYWRSFRSPLSKNA